MKISIFCLAMLFAFDVSAQKSAGVSANQKRAITVVSKPQAKVWIDGVLYGTTDESGRLAIKPVTTGTHQLRVRADNFKEISQTLTAAQKGEIKIALTEPADAAELAFQEAERLSLIDRQKAIAAYRRAISLRPKYPEANLALARISADALKFDDAHAAIVEAKKARPVYPEASAVEGRIYKAEGEEEKAIAAYKRAVTEGKGFQPEAQTGLALIYKERADLAGGGGDFQGEEENYLLAAEYFKKAVAQLSGAPDAITIYQFLGLAYERIKKYDEAIAVYEEFLDVFPDANEATAVKSFITQLKKQMSEQ